MTSLRFVFVALTLLALVFARQDDEPWELDPAMHHLGDNATPEWSEAPAEPEGGGLEFTFEGRAVAGETTLELTRRHVDDPWHVEINGRRVGRLATGAELSVQYLPLPAGLLRAGENTFRLVGSKPTDDITVGRIRLHPRPFRAVLDLQPVVVSVSDSADGSALPARVTLVDAAGQLAPLYFAVGPLVAVRPGVIYQADGAARFELARGSYTVHATRGPEWSLASAPLELDAGGARLDLTLTREVDTAGYIACDTHIHTLTHSGHGDSSVEERQVTLAGEGVELAIATDHNHNTDYAPTQRELGLTAWYTPVVGNEVTTDIGHFNAFPLDPAAPVPPHGGKDVVAVVDGIRAAGAQVVILNHPRWPDHERGPFGVAQLDVLSGASLTQHPYDALELINSQTVEPDPLSLFRDWFSLLDRGERLVAVASSDSHTVGGVVGGGRTYVQSSSDDPAALDVDELARNMAAGRASLSMGIFCDLRVDEGFRMGDLVPGGPQRTHALALDVRAPSWVRPTSARVFVNGELAREVAVPTQDGRPTAASLDLPLAGSARDAWVVVVVSGEGVGGPWWPILNDYTLAATNPVFLDGDGDGVYSPPRVTAARLLEAGGHDPAALAALLEGVGDSVALQALDLAREAWLEEAEARLDEVVRGAAGGGGRLRAWLDARPAR